MAEFPPATLGEPEYRSLYKQEIATMRCLEGMGIPPQQPISEQQYVDEYAAGNPPSWSAYAVVPPDRFAEAEKRCPQPSVDK